MWEKFKNSRFFMHVQNSRAVYVTVLTLILALSVLITVTAVSNRAKKKEAQNDSSSSSQQDGNDGSTNQSNPPQSSSSSKPNVNESDIGKEEQSGNTDSESSDADAAVPELALPVVGMIAKGYDSTLQVYSTTMGDYRIHLGLDVSTEDAAPVLAAADGVVSQIWDDPLMGTCVAISHTGDCYTIYKNLAPTLTENLTVGSEVKEGDCIGNVGQSAVLELAEEPHLHFEMTVDGLSVNPLEYFSEQAMAQLSEAKDATEVSVNVTE